MTTRKHGEPDLPRLMTLKEFCAHYGRNWKWGRRLLREDRIPAAQLVGGKWVIPIDAVVIPAYAVGLPNSVIDIIPDHLGTVATGEYVEVPEEKPPRRAELGKSQSQPHYLYLTALKRLRVERGYSQDVLAFKSGCQRRTISEAERGKGVIAKTAIKLSRALEVDYEDLMREE